MKTKPKNTWQIISGWLSSENKIFPINFFILKCIFMSWSLCRAVSNRVRGAPFRPVRAMAVDLFPQTMHCETILLFERVDYSSETQTTETWSSVIFIYRASTTVSLPFKHWVKFKYSLFLKSSTDFKVLKTLPHFCKGFFSLLFALKTAQDISFWSSIYLHKQITVYQQSCVTWKEHFFFFRQLYLKLNNPTWSLQW